MRHFDESVKIKESEKACYVIKAYGKDAWQDAANLDVLKICDQLLYDSIPPEMKGQHDVCITSPFYFWPEGVNDPEILTSEINLSLTSSDGAVINNADVEILINGVSIKSIQIENGIAKFQMPVHGMLKITTENKTIYRSLFMDFKPHRDLLEKLASGKWMNDFEPESPFEAGEVPWEAFNFEETRNLLTNVDWEIIFSENERDNLWDEFEKKFRP
jgi:hypothetical protein